MPVRKETAFAWYRDLDGNLLTRNIAATEVINILRPIVAIAIYIAFIFHAIHHYEGEKNKLLSGNEESLPMFVQEVRRFYPFFPSISARVKKVGKDIGRISIY